MPDCFGRFILLAALTLGITGLVGGCGRPPEAGEAAAAARSRVDNPLFRDITRQAGIRFVHDAAATGRHYFVETMGAGVAFLDYDGDGRQDLLYLNGKPLPGYLRKGPLYPALYRNRGGGRFQDVTSAAGLAVEMYGMGIAVGDYDNDSDDDLYVTATLGRSYLFRNESGRFVDVAGTAGVEHPGTFPTSAAWVDFDRDGRLDLYVCGYVRYRSVADDLPCTFKDGIRSYCIPFAYKAEPNCLYRNLGNGTFEDVAKPAGVGSPDGKSLGVATWDLNDDGWPDLVIANDTTPTHVYINERDGTFRETAAVMGLAYGVNGVAKAGMGIDVADDRNRGLPAVAVGNFSGEMVGFYRACGNGLFQEESVESGIGRPSEQYLAFGLFFFDYDNDGWQDLYVANGHVQDMIEQFTEGVTYKEPPLLYRNLGDGRYEEVAARAGGALHARLVSRGAAWGDIDDDGRIDIALNNNQGPATLWRNESAHVGHWLKIRLVGTRSNRNGYGARVTVTSRAGRQLREARSGSSYCSQSDQRLHFGLGAETAAGEIVIRWPSGSIDRLRSVPADQILTVQEGSHP